MFNLSRIALQRLARLVASTGLGASTLDPRCLDIRIRDLPRDLAGTRLALISDLHVGDGAWQPMQAAEAAALVKDSDPDVCLNAGDFVQWDPPLEQAVEVAAQFILPTDAGLKGNRNVAILGNHDYYLGHDAATRLRRHLESRGIVVLENESIRICLGNGELSVTGLAPEAPGFDSAVTTLMHGPHPRIALIHAPDTVERLPRGAADLVLTGHTHGGQVVVPGLARRIAWKYGQTRYVAGLYCVNDMPVYVGRGLGCTGLPLRFRARPEVTFLRLVR